MRELRNPVFWLVALFGLFIVFLIPRVAEVYTLYNLTVFAVLAVLALSLGLVWGYGGILALGQTAFFGIGAYVYAVISVNMADSTLGIVAAILVPSFMAAIIGYFTFFGRVSDVYFAVISLTIPLILFNLVNSASGPAFQFGNVHLGGYNGIPGVPPINNPLETSDVLTFEGMFYAAALLLLMSYLCLRVLIATKFGRIVVAVKENELRADLLGYDVRLYKLGIFSISAAFAGVAGAMYAAWGSSIGPDVFSLSFAAQTVIWVLFGGLGTLLGPIVGSFVVQIFSTWLGSMGAVNTEIILGAFFIAAVLLVPNGVVPSVRDYWRLKKTKKSGGK